MHAVRGPMENTKDGERTRPWVRAVVAASAGLLVFVCVGFVCLHNLSGNGFGGQERFRRRAQERVSVQVLGDPLMRDIFLMWNTFRDPRNGLFCDHSPFAASDGESECGTPDRSRYSSAGTGMGLIADCVFAELGFLSRAVAQNRTLQTLSSLLTHWPREHVHGFYMHFTDDSFHLVGKYSTVDTAEMVLGALFAGNYFGGYVQEQAQTLARGISWSDAIRDGLDPRVYTFSDAAGSMSGSIKPFNEYFTLAYIAQLMDPTLGSKAHTYYATYMGYHGAPTGLEGCPAHGTFAGHDLLTGGCSKAHFVSSFAIQFNWFLTKGFHQNRYYSETLFPAFLAADMAFADAVLNESSEVWGRPVKGRLWGCGASPGPDGYHAHNFGRGGNKELVFSAAIMAGFLGAADDKLRGHITEQLRWLTDNEVCTYVKETSTGERLRIPWVCSVAHPSWRAEVADSIDFSGLVLGYAVNFLPKGFYAQYVA